MKKKNKIFSFLDVTIITIITSVIMCFLGGLLIYKHLGGVNYSVLGTDEKLQEFIAAYNNLLDNYYDSLDKNSLIDGAINGMYSQVDDPYTTYLDGENTESLNSSLSGEYEGIGIKFEALEDGTMSIVEVFDDSPAKKVGLLVGDIITKVNGEDTTTKTSSEIVSIIKSSANQKVNLTINRNGSELSFNVEVDKLLVPVVTSEILQKNGHNVGYIRLTVFNDTADVQFTNALTSLENTGIESLIVDLRSNTGGYLQVAKNIAEMFLEKGKIIYSLENKDGIENFKDETSEKRNYKITVLINKSSASASEILAASLKYSYGASLLGETSYGKGKVQEKATLTDGTTVKYTTAKWLTPNGDCIDGVGLTPDTELVLDTSIYNSDDITTDNQVMMALNQLVG